MRSRFWIKIFHPELWLTKLQGGSAIEAAATLAIGRYGRHVCV